MGSALIWLGVLAWAPFIILRVAGQKPQFWWFLPFHLLGVVGGARMRAMARKNLTGLPARKDPLKLAGHALIWTGVLVWAVYFYMKYAMQQPVEAMQFLPYHLTGVLGGLAVLGIRYLRQKDKS